MLNFFIGFAFFEAGAFFGFFVAALLNAAHAGQEISIKFEGSGGDPFWESATRSLTVKSQRTNNKIPLFG